MLRLIEKRYVIRRNLLQIVAMLLTVYFGFHLMAGQRSLPYLLELQSYEADFEQELDDLAQERIALESRVKRLRPTSLDPDFLQERARVMLGFTREGELVLPQPAGG